MKSHTLFSILLLLTATIHAQITITNATFPVAGDTLKLAYAANPEVGIAVYTPPGGVQFWDLSGLQTGVTEDIIYKPSDQGTVSAQVPEADLFAVLSPNSESYYNVTPTSFENQAYYGTYPYNIVNPHLFDNSPLIPERRAPMNFFDLNATSSGILEYFVPADFSPQLMQNLAALTGNAQIDSIRYRVGINRLDVVDAYGSMSIPGGTYDVLREKRTMYREARIDGKVPPLGWLDITSNAIQAGFIGLGVDTIVTYHFYNDVAKEPIAIVTFNNQQNAATQVVFKNSTVVSSTSNVAAPAPSITISPNPATSEAIVSFKDVVPVDYRLLMFDAQGQLIQQNTVHLSENSTVKLDLSRFLPGTYVITLYDDHNRISCQKKLMKGGE